MPKTKGRNQLFQQFHRLEIQNETSSYMKIEICKKQYTGKSINHMHTRHCGHRSEIENETSELGVHFAACGLENLELQIIDCVREG